MIPKSAATRPRRLFNAFSSFVQSNKPKILGIETSCDDTGCAIVNSSGKILGEALHSQNLVHLRNGGINPITAQELHREHIDAVVEKAMERTGSPSLSDIDAIAVTVKPGLLASLDIGVKYANYIARKNQKPLIPIHHMEAHALVARMYYDLPFPFLVLLVSGGHSMLAVANDVDEFVLLGNTLDDAPGEAFDKVARRMKLRNIPQLSTLSGGRAVELAATKSTNPEMFKFPLPLAKMRDCNFSFSGLKESLYRKLREKETEHNTMGDGLIPEVYNLCASFQNAVAEHIAHRTDRAIQFCLKRNMIAQNNANLVVSGGVACNNLIFKAIEGVGSKSGFKVFCPPPKVCTDNGIMIAWNGIEKFTKGNCFKSELTIKDIDPKAPLGVSLINEVSNANIQVKVTCAFRQQKSVSQRNFDLANI